MQIHILIRVFTQTQFLIISLGTVIRRDNSCSKNIINIGILNNFSTNSLHCTNIHDEYSFRTDCFKSPERLFSLSTFLTLLFFLFKISPNFSFANASYRLLLEKEKKKKNEWTILITLILRDSRNNSKSSGYVGSFDGVKDTKASFIILYMYVRKSKFILFR